MRYGLLAWLLATTAASIILATLVCDRWVYASEQLYDGLPDELPPGFLSEEGFVTFEQATGNFRAPFGARFFINGESIRPDDFGRLSEVFSERFLATIPRGTAIRSYVDSQGREVWDYPVGTRVVHEITWTNAARSLFEMRLVEKVAISRWAYGVYIPSADAEKLGLAKYAGMPDGQFALKSLSGKDFDVRLKRINLTSCQACHFATSPSAYQVFAKTEMGPCGFAPANSSIRSDWASRFMKLRGQPPFN